MAERHPHRPPLDPAALRSLPPPVRLEDTRTSHDVVPVPDTEDAWREAQWLLRTAGMP